MTSLSPNPHPRSSSSLPLGLGLLLFVSGLGAAPVFNNVAANASTVERLDKFELSFTLSGTTYSNAFDPAQIAVAAVFTSPSAQSVTVDGFYMRDFTRTGPPETLSPGAWTWRVRFSPQETGAWAYRLTATDGGSGQGSYGPQGFTCAASTRKGFVRLSPSDNRYFEYEDGSQFIPIGENVGWGDSGATYDYDNWINRMADQGADFARYWMCPWYHSIEWQSTGLGDYSNLMNDAWRLDYDLDLARDRNVTVMLALLNHGSVSSVTDPNWAQSPYNAANGGPCADTHAFFTDATARAYWTRHLRYCVARWGYASNLVWELCNEINWTDNYGTDAAVRSDVDSWLHAMAVTVRAFDSGRHLVTNSFGSSQWEPAVWNDPAIDFTQIHVYNASPALEDVIRAQVAAYRAAYPAKPVHVGEFGLNVSGDNYAAADPTGIAFHNVMWGDLLGESTGSGASWWWDNYIDPQNLYHHYRGLAVFAAALNFPQGSFTYASPIVTTAAYQAVNVTGALGWGVQAPANNFTLDGNGNLTPSVQSLSNYLYGNPYHPELYKGPVTFHVTFPAAGTFSVKVGTGSPYPPLGLRINVDGGADLFNGQVSTQTSYPVPVGTGPHVIVVDNTMNDWFQVQYVFNPYVPALKVDALQGPATIAAWVLNRGYNYVAVGASGPPAPVTGGSIRFTGATNGTWGVEWWDPASGALAESGSAVATGGNLDLAVPSVAWDKALILRYGVGPNPTSTPSATPNPTATATPAPGPAQAWPNLLQGAARTTVFRVPEQAATLKVTILTLAGERAGVLRGEPGTSRCAWDASGFASGLYLASVDITEGDGSKRRETLKVLVLK